MFTGIIEEVGTVISVQKGAASSFIEIKAETVLSDVHLGDSIAVNGVCLTVISFSSASFRADVMNETLSRSSLGSLKQGSPVNLERAMAADGRFGGHIVSGHIDGTGIISKTEREDNAVWYTIKAPEKLMRYIVEKGSIAIDGISLTVAKAGREEFAVSVIPHTMQETTLATKGAGQIVNLENDVVGKYIERFLEWGKEIKPEEEKSGITMEFLANAGY